MLKMKLKNIRARGAGTPTCAECCATCSVCVGGLTLQQDSWSQSGQPHYQQEGEHLGQQERSTLSLCVCVCITHACIYCTLYMSTIHPTSGHSHSYTT